ncbi:MAG: N-acetylglucosamine-binding protein GbpA [Photobacterium frigidiphilum]|uniref:N-acetylglucosamine-binding protein GbpA n=1 Tax=Photobacterium frigidiphilum TaxID=264736 RepID=UPI0030013BB1
MMIISKKTLLPVTLALFSSGVMAHGYVSSVEGGVAESRAALCKFPANGTGEKNTNCGSVEWEPQSVEGPDGFPETGPPDGKIASAGLSQFSPLDEQTVDRWVKRPMQAGMQNFEWTFTANHITRNWRYYITKQDWNPNKSLTRSAFDLTPFCQISGDMAEPPMRVHHSCNVPERKDYQVILAVWEVGNTPASFYNVIDVMFDGDLPTVPDWAVGGQIYPSMDLKSGDSVYTRVFDASGENNALSTELTIETEQQGQANNWSYSLAQQINNVYDNIRAGKADGEGNFAPSYGTNPIYLQDGSGLKRVEIGYNIITPEPDYDLDISGLENEYQIGDEPVSLELNLTAQGDQFVELTVYNHNKEALANKQVTLNDGDSQAVSMELSKSEPGHHMLVTRIKDSSEGNLINQITNDFHLTEGGDPPEGDYDYIFPEGLKSYTAGSKVLATDGRIYECKSFPYSGYCIQWSPTATQFEPGVGSDWSTAWNKLN